MNQELRDEARAHFNEPVLIGFELARVVGYAEDDDDCYLVVRYPRGSRRRSIGWVSFVGGYIYLDCLRCRNAVTGLTGETWDDFSRLDGALTANGAPRESEFICAHTVARLRTNPRQCNAAEDAPHA